MTETQRLAGRERMRAYRAAHPDYYRTSQRQERASGREARKAMVMSPEQRAAKAAEHEREKRRKYRQDHPLPPRRSPAEIRESRRLYYLANKDRQSVRRKAWRLAHSTEAAAAAKSWREANPERFKAQATRWRQDNWQKVLECNGRRRAAMRTTEIERIDRLAIYSRDDGMCYLCGASVDERSFTLDHVIPLARGGPHTADNLRVAHLHCNLRKGVTPLSKYLAPMEAKA